MLVGKANWESSLVQLVSGDMLRLAANGSLAKRSSLSTVSEWIYYYWPITRLYMQRSMYNLFQAPLWPPFSYLSQLCLLEGTPVRRNSSALLCVWKLPNRSNRSDCESLQVLRKHVENIWQLGDANVSGDYNNTINYEGSCFASPVGCNRRL